MRIEDIGAGIGAHKCGVGIQFGNGQPVHVFLHPCKLYDGYAPEGDLHHELMACKDSEGNLVSWWDELTKEWYNGYPLIKKYFGETPPAGWSHLTGCNDSFEAGYVVVYDPFNYVYVGTCSVEKLSDGNKYDSWNLTSSDYNNEDTVVKLPPEVDGWLAPCIDQ